MRASGNMLPNRAAVIAAGASTPSGNFARDGDIAIREEFDAAKEKNTLAAWELFIARHPEHPLTERAKDHAAALKDQTPQGSEIRQPRLPDDKGVD